MAQMGIRLAIAFVFGFCSAAKVSNRDLRPRLPHAPCMLGLGHLLPQILACCISPELVFRAQLVVVIVLVVARLTLACGWLHGYFVRLVPVVRSLLLIHLSVVGLFFVSIFSVILCLFLLPAALRDLLVVRLPIACRLSFRTARLVARGLRLVHVRRLLRWFIRWLRPPRTGWLHSLRINSSRDKSQPVAGPHFVNAVVS